MKELSMHEMVSVQGGGWFGKLLDYINKIILKPIPLPSGL